MHKTDSAVVSGLNSYTCPSAEDYVYWFSPKFHSSVSCYQEWL